MTERPTELKTASPDAASDPTVTDTARVDSTACVNPEENQETPPSDRDPLAFDPGKLSRFVIPMALQHEMLKVKPPRLGPEYFHDTVPPNQPLAAPAPSAEAEPTPVIAKRRPPVGVVIVCLLGVVLLLGLAIARSSNRDPEPNPVAPSPSKTEIAPTPVVPAAPALVVPPSPAISAGTAEDAVKIPPAKGPTAQRIPARPSPDRSLVSKPNPSVLAGTPTVRDAQVTTPPPPPASNPDIAPSTPPPVRSSWFHK